jgi:hypothetical protein
MQSRNPYNKDEYSPNNIYNNINPIDPSMINFDTFNGNELKDSIEDENGKIAPTTKIMPKPKNILGQQLATAELLAISTKRNEKFSGQLHNLIMSNQEKDGDAGISRIANALMGGGKVLDLTEKVKFNDENGKEIEYSADDLVTGNKFSTLSDKAQQNFLAAFSDPNRGKSDTRKTLDKSKKWFLAGFGLVGTASGIAGLGLLIAGTTVVGGAATFGIAPAIVFGVIGGIGIVVSVSLLVNKIIKYVKNSKIAKKNVLVKDKLHALSQNVYKDKDLAIKNIEQSKKTILNEITKDPEALNSNSKADVANAANSLDSAKQKIENNPKFTDKIKKNDNDGYSKKEEKPDSHTDRVDLEKLENDNSILKK